MAPERRWQRRALPSILALRGRTPNCERGSWTASSYRILEFSCSAMTGLWCCRALGFPSLSARPACGGPTVAPIKGPRAIAEVCASADLPVSLVLVRCACSGGPFIDRFDIRCPGAHALRLCGGAEVPRLPGSREARSLPKERAISVVANKADETTLDFDPVRPEDTRLVDCIGRLECHRLSLAA